MTHFARLTALLFALSLPALAADPLRFYSHEATLEGNGGGLVRLRLTPPVLSIASPDLSDVRVIGKEGTEIPYVIDRGTTPPPPAQVEPKITSLTREAHETDRQHWTRTETIKLEAPPATMSGPLRLRALTQDSEWVANVTASWAKADGKNRKTGQPGTVSGVWFRLPDGRSLLTLELPETPTSELTLTIEAVHDTFVTPRFFYEPVKPESAPATIETNVPVETSTRNETNSEYVLQANRGHVVQLLTVNTTTALYEREVRVEDAQSGSYLGSGTIFRAGDRSLNAITLDHSSPHLRVRIENGNSPPLEGVSFTARIEAPTLVFELPSTGATLVFGGGRVRPPAYDLQGLLGHGLEALPSRTIFVGSPRARPSFAPDRPMEFAVAAGAELDDSPFAWSGTLYLNAGTNDGVSRIPLPAAWTSLMRKDLADVRIVDAQKRQWPYVVQQSDSGDEVNATAASQGTSHGATTWNIKFALAPFALKALKVNAMGVFADRPYRVEAEGKPVAEGMLHFDENHWASIPLSRRLNELNLVIFDGDDAPLQVDMVQGVAETPALYTVAPSGTYTLLAGFEKAEAPHYQLESVRELLVTARSSDVVPPAVIKNPAFSKAAQFRAMGDTGMVWIALIAAILVLAGMTLRLARTPVAKAEKTEPPATQDEGPTPRA